MPSTTNKQPIDIWMVTHQRKELTFNAINYLNDRTKYPYRLFVVDNSSTDGTSELLKEMEEDGRIFLSVAVSRNIGIHMAHNIGLSLVLSELSISTDNDIYVPDLGERCWLTRLVELMDKYEEYAAIACQPHVFLGDSVSGKDEIINKPHCGAVMRIMRTKKVREVGGWDRHFDANRNHEEKTVCSRLRNGGSEVGYARDITCYHDFGDDNNWGYKEIHPHVHGHRIPGEEIWPTPEMLNNPDLDHKTWKAK